MKDFYIKNKKILNIVLVVVFSIGFFGVANVVYARAIDAAVVTLIGWIASLIIMVCGWVLGMAIKAILVIANYNNFINETTIIDAWVIVRDLCNMFFVLILLVIAFATILRIENYNVKKLLPKLLIMAVLINFSRTIVGLMIDFSQIIMLTFVSAFSDGGGNFIKALRVDDFLSLAKDNKWGLEGKELNLTNTVAAMVVAIIFLIIATVVMLAILAVLVMRVIMFWIYIVLSPLAFLLSAFPGGQKYASQYWGEFTKYLVNGPVLAFFIWLSLITMNNLGEFSNSAFFIESQTIMLPDTTAVSSILFDRNFMAFIMAIGFLVGGLMISSQIGGMGANWGASTVKGLGSRVGGIAKKGALGTLKGGLKGARNAGGFLVDKASVGAKKDLNIFRGYERMKNQMDENKKQRANKIYGLTLDSAREGSRTAAVLSGDVGWQNITKNFGGLMKGKNVHQYRKNYIKDEEERKTMLTTGEADKKIESIQRTEIGRINDREKKIADLKEQRDKIKVQKGAKNAPRRKIQEEINAIESEKDNIRAESNTKVNEIRKMINDPRAEELNKSIEHNKTEEEKYALVGADTAEANARAELESNEAKKIANIENAGQLGRILKEAIRTGNQGLIAAVGKKMTRGGDYNEMNKAFGFGTGTEGMLKLAGKFREGGMTQQSSLALVGEIGNIAKNIKHFGAFGAVQMKNGRWEESKPDEAQEAQLAEMLKIEPQEYARTMGHLGQGFYDEEGNWENSKAGLAYLKANEEKLKEHYEKRGQQHTVELIFSRKDQLKNNNIDSNSELYKVFEKGAKTSGKGGIDVNAEIKEIK